MKSHVFPSRGMSLRIPRVKPRDSKTHPAAWEAMAFTMLALFAGPIAADDQREAKVGMTQRIDQIVLPGSELEAKPLGDRQAPVVLRIGSASPHGTAFRYDLVYY